MYEGKLVRLRALRPEDAPAIEAWLNDPDTARRAAGGAPMPYMREEQERWIAEQGGHQRDEYRFAVETLDGRLVGMCSWMSADFRNRRCRVGWVIGNPDLRGRGLGTDTIRTLLRVCFDELNMHSVSLTVHAFNPEAERLYRRLGFHRDGAMRDSQFTMGRWWDTYLYSMLEDEYRALAERD